MNPSSSIRSRILVLLCLLIEGNAFTIPSSPSAIHRSISIGGAGRSDLQSPSTSQYPQISHPSYERTVSRTSLLSSKLSEDNTDDVTEPQPSGAKRHRIRQFVVQKFQSLSTKLLLLRRPQQQNRTNKKTIIPWAVRLAIASASLGVGLPPHRYVPSILTTPMAQASAPVMALPKAEGRDPANEAVLQHERKMRTEAQQELTDMAQKAREIEATQGEKARIKFEKEFKEQQEQRAVEKQQGLIQLQRNLLDQGIDPFVDLEGQRQVMFYEKGVDLGDVPGTPFHLDKELERSNYKRSMAFLKASHRQIIACMVQDLKNRNLDPLEYFQSHQDRTETILNLPLIQAKALAEQYAKNLELYGQIKEPEPGEISALERMKQQSNDPAAQKAVKAAAKQEAARIKAEEKARQAAERQQQRELREQMKLETKRQAEMVKAQVEASAKRAASQAKEAAAAAAAAAIDSSRALQESAESMDDVVTELSSSSAAPQRQASLLSTKKKLPILPVSSFLIAAGGGGYAVKLYREKAQRDEEERQRRFQLLMGGGSSSEKKSSSSSFPANGASASSSSTSLLLDEDTIEMKPPAPSAPSPKIEPTTVATAAAPATASPKKKRRGLNVFARRKNEREVDLMALVSDGARAPQFAMLLSKILTFGAPGRFPNVVSLPVGMPMDTFDLESAKEMLVEARLSAQLELDESAEIFADVVNCMLIDIVDLASSSLKEGDDKTTIAAIDIVVDFMQHAASLYDTVAGNVVISPVTYGGTLSRSKLEQMYSTYAGSAMSNLDNVREDFDDRVRLLQDVFQITDKKAEGLMLKVMQKNMMEMLKSGEGLEGMQEMLAGMGGMDGMAPNGMPGMDGNEPTPEQVKEMLLALKSMKDSGSFSKEELDTIKKEFKASFGSSVEDLPQGQPLDATEQELLDLMKSILED